MTKSLFAAVAAAALSIASAIAPAFAQQQDPVSRPRDIISSYALENVVPVLNELGFQTTQSEANGARAVTATRNGRTLLVLETVCAQPGSCAGLWMIALINESVSTETTNAFNSATRTVRASTTNGALYLDRYLIGDYGAARGSLAVNFEVFAQSIDLWFQFSSQAGSGTGSSISFAPAPAPSADAFVPEIDAATRDWLIGLAVDGGVSNDRTPGKIRR